ncbi:MAG TPA: ATP-binding protein [Anaerolineales bacterium]|nr:ATP-binding protein [Anaerolineales bacterium]
MKLSQTNDSQSESNAWTLLKEECKNELESSRRELKEIGLMIEQSQLEVTKLQQRNASISAHLQQIQAQFDTMSKADIRMAYDSALDAQQRLFVMRGQIDKLQSDQTHIERYLAILEQVLQTIETGGAQESGRGGHSAMAQTVEMLIQAQESERQRLARQMHDGPAQALSNFILQAEIAMRFFDIDQAKAKEELLSVKTSATSTFQKVRDFIFELRPMMLDDLGLAPTLSRYVEAFKEQSGMDVRLASTGMEQRLEAYLEVMIFRAIQELLGNAARHSQAAQVKLQIDASENEVRVSVEDNGRGFDVDTMGDKGGMGLKVIKDRVEMLGGKMDIHSVIGQGTHIIFVIPASKPAVFA